MKKYFKLFLVFITVLFVSCNLGMGTAIDLEDPEITITSPGDGENLNKKFRIEGTCSDNIGVTSIIVSVGEKNLAKASIHGERWYADLTMEEGDYLITCTARDSFGNCGARSKAVVNVIVDQTAPDAQSWTIDRGNNKTVNPVSKQTLEGMDLNLSNNRFYPQNEKFTIKGQFQDAISISEITLHLYEENELNEDELIVSKKLTTENITSGSIYSPSWSYTHDELVSKRPGLDTGKHYLKIRYEAKDDAGNTRVSTAGYLLWYPESDIPGIQQKDTENEELLVTAGSSISVDFFDDDEIKEIGYSFITEAVKNSEKITLSNVAEKVTEKLSVSGVDNYQKQISTLKIDGTALGAGTYYLLAYVKDINNKTKTRLIKVTLSDASKPLLIIETPIENEVPAVTGASKFKFKGYSYDTTGSSFVKIVYIPTTSTYNTDAKKKARAKELLNDESLKTANEIIETHQFVEISSKPAAVDNFVKEAFEFEFDLLNDFPADKNSPKFFYLQLQDIDKNVVEKQMTVAADISKPEIKIASPADDMEVIDYSAGGLTLKFNASKSSGLGIDESTYKLYRKAEDGSKEAEFVCTFANSKLKWDASKEYVTVSIDKDELAKWANGSKEDGYKADNQPVFVMEAADILGNKGSATRTVVLSPLPVLNEVTVDQADGNTYCAGTKITFQAKFSDTVKVTGEPRLKLTNIANNNQVVTNAYAVFDKEANKTNSDTLKFYYIVKDNDWCPAGIEVDGTQIDLNGGTIVTGTQGTGAAKITYKSGANFWDSEDKTKAKKIMLDGVKPTIKGIKSEVIGLSDINGYKYAKANTEILTTVTFSEPIVINGSVNLKAGNINCIQYSMSEDGKSVTYSYVVGSTKNGNSTTVFNNQKFTCRDSNCYSFETDENSKVVFSAIKDKAGNVLAGNKEVKIYDLGVIFDTTIPNVPAVTGIEYEIYNKPPVFAVEKNASDNDIYKLEVSIDNGQTWIDFTNKSSTKSVEDAWAWGTDDNDGKLTIVKGGTYNIIAKATDKAGNVSANSDAIKIIYNDEFPEILDIKVACENGNYKKDTELVFKVFLSDTLKPYIATDATLKFETITATAGSTPRTINVEPSGDETLSSVLVFKHKVTTGDKYNGIKISELKLNTLRDKYNNPQSEKTEARIKELIDDEESGCHRPLIKVDGDAPIISTTSPKNGKVVSGVDENGLLSVELRFNEPVYRDSGTITLQRKGNWGIPAVMSVDDFNKVYNSSKLTAADRETLMRTVKGDGTGNELLDARTGIAVGPYRKITQGLELTEDGLVNSGVPDTTTKFVLDFNLGLFEGETRIDPYGNHGNYDVSVADIRAVFEKAGYHQHSVQMNSPKITTTDNLTYKVTFPVKIQEGIEWELLISEGAFRDEVGNLFAGLKSENQEGFDSTKDKSYTLWSNNASIPVVRVDRYSHGYGAIEPKSTNDTVFNAKDLASNTGFINITEHRTAGQSFQNNTGGKIAPTGYVRVRIDTQTPGASIMYRDINTGAFDATTGLAVSGTVDWTEFKLTNGVNVANSTGKNSTTTDAKGYLFNDNTNSSERCTVTSIPDATKVDLNKKTGSGITFTTVTPENNAGVILVVGDGKYQTARKDYITAYAKLENKRTDSGESMTNSAIGAEGVFKTVIFSRKYQSNNQFSIEGGTFMGGEPKVSGFPVRDGESPQYSKNCYHIRDDNNENIWNSYEIVSTNWAVLLRESDNSKNYPRSSYGQSTFVCGYIHY